MMLCRYGKRLLNFAATAPLVLLTIQNTWSRSVPAALFVTHADSTWDANRIAQNGVNAAIRAVKQLGGETYYLVTSQSLMSATKYLSGQSDHCTQYFDSLQPNRLVSSSSGEHRVNPDTNTVLFVGGHFEGCLYNSVLHLIELKKWEPDRPISLIFVTDGIYEGVFRPPTDKRLLQGLISRGSLPDFSVRTHWGKVGINPVRYSVSVYHQGRVVQAGDFNGRQDLNIDFIHSSEIAEAVRRWSE